MNDCKKIKSDNREKLLIVEYKSTLFDVREVSQNYKMNKIRLKRILRFRKTLQKTA